MAEISRLISNCLNGSTTLLWVSGESGVGKSKLMAQVAGLCSRHRFSVRQSSCEAGGGAPFSSVSELLDFEVPLDGLGDRYQLATRFDRAVSMAGSEQPLALLIDDVQWADYGTSMFLSHCLMNTVGAVFIAMFARPLEGSGSSPEVEDLYQRVWQRGISTFQLGNLDVAATGQLANQVMSSDLSEQAKEMIFSETAGHPFTVLHYCRSLKESRFTEIQPNSVTSIPVEIDNLLNLRLERLSSIERTVLECIAIVSSHSDIHSICSISGLQELPVADALESLGEKGFVCGTTPDVNPSHGLLRRAVIGQLSEAKKVAYSRIAARVIEKQDAPNLLELASLYDRIGDHEGAFKSLWELGKRHLRVRSPAVRDYLIRAREKIAHFQCDQSEMDEFLLDLCEAELIEHNLIAAHTLLERTEVGRDGRYRCRRTTLRGRIEFGNGEYEEAGSTFLESLSLSEGKKERARLYALLSATMEGLGRIDDAIDYLGAAAKEQSAVRDEAHDEAMTFIAVYDAFLRRQYVSATAIAKRNNGFACHLSQIRAAFYAADYVECRRTCRKVPYGRRELDPSWACERLYYLSASDICTGNIDAAIETLEWVAREEKPSHEKSWLWCLSLLVEAYIEKADSEMVARTLEVLSSKQIIDGETSTVVWRAKAKAHAYFLDEETAVSCFEEAVRCSIPRRAAEWAMSVLEYANFDLDRGNWAGAHRTLALARPDFERMQIPRHKERFDRLLSVTDEHHLAQSGSEMVGLVLKLETTDTVAGVFGLVLTESKKIENVTSVRVRFNADIFESPNFGHDPNTNKVVVSSDSGRVALTAMSDVEISSNSGVADKLRALCSLGELKCGELADGHGGAIVFGDNVESFHKMIGVSKLSRALWDDVKVAASCDEPVLVVGETGTGKDLVARAVHKESERRDRPFVSLNCAALSDDLLLSELFGHVKGAFTGAYRDHDGVFQSADTGVLFLDEIGEASPRVQASLLRVLQSGVVRRLGESREKKVDVRVIFATNRDLVSRSRDGSFRRDLLYRLQVLEIAVPPLRDRVEDIPVLVTHFLSKLSDQTGKRVDGVSQHTMEHLMAAQWPGNIRELENKVRSMFVRAKVGESAKLEDTNLNFVQEEYQGSTLKSQVELLEKNLIKEALHEVRGNVSVAAKRLGMSRSGLQKKITKYQLSKQA